MRVLLMEADATWVRRIRELLEFESMVVDVTDSGEDGISLCKLYEYDVVVLEVRLLEADGFEVIRRLRDAKQFVPILVCSHVYDMEHLFRAFRLGADDFLDKPFNSRELVARVHALSRRSSWYRSSIIEIENLKIDLHEREAAIDDNTVPLTVSEFALLELLARRRGQIISKERFMQHLYQGGDEEVDEKIIDVFICKLRAKLNAMNWTCRILTLWGKGYRIPYKRSKLELVHKAA